MLKEMCKGGRKGFLSLGILPGNIIFLEVRGGVGNKSNGRNTGLLRREGTLWWQWLVGSFLGTRVSAVLFMIHEGMCPSRPISSRLLREASALSVHISSLPLGGRRRQ